MTNLVTETYYIVTRKSKYGRTQVERDPSKSRYLTIEEARARLAAIDEHLEFFQAGSWVIQKVTTTQVIEEIER